MTLQKAAEIACGNIPKLSGPVLIGLDTSGSMSMPVTDHHGRGATSKMRCVDVAALFAAAILRRNPDSLVIPFDTRAYDARIDPQDMGDLPAFFIYGPQNNRSVPLRVWGPGGGGTRPEWGTKAAMDHMEKTWAWMTGTLAGTIDTTSFRLDVTEG